MIGLYCAEQLDGVAAAAIVTRFAKLKKIVTRFCGYLHNETLVEELERISPETPVFVLDMCPHEKHLQVINNIKVLYWSTHDPSAVDLKVKIFDKTSEKKCSAELAQERFLPNDQIAKKLARLAHESTYWHQSEQAKKLSDAIASKINTAELIQSLSNGVVWNELLEKKHQEYLQKKEVAFQFLLKNLMMRKYLRYNFGFSLSSGILTSADAGQKVLDVHKGVDVSVVLYKNGKVSFRKRNDCEIDLKRLAQLFDGGGHSYASGAGLFKKINRQNFEKTINEILSKIRAEF